MRYLNPDEVARGQDFSDDDLGGVAQAGLEVEVADDDGEAAWLEGEVVGRDADVGAGIEDLGGDAECLAVVVFAGVRSQEVLLIPGEPVQDEGVDVVDPLIRSSKDSIGDRRVWVVKGGVGVGDEFLQVIHRFDQWECGERQVAAGEADGWRGAVADVRRHRRVLSVHASPLVLTQGELDEPLVPRVQLQRCTEDVVFLSVFHHRRDLAGKDARLVYACSDSK